MTILEEAEQIETPSGLMRVHIARPLVAGRYPSLILWSEIFQITGPISRMAAFLAGHGFLVAVPEIYHEYEESGVALSYDDAGSARGNELKTTKPLENYDSDARATLDFVKSHPSSNGKLGTMGICIGGHLAFRTAFNADVAASVCFYATDIHKRGLGAGLNDDSLDRMKEITGEMLMIWGRQDPHISREGRRLIYEAMSDADLNFQWIEVNGAHAFLRDEGPRYNPVLASQCLSWAVEMLSRNLSDGDLGGNS